MRRKKTFHDKDGETNDATNIDQTEEWFRNETGLNLNIL